jgi:hypothetical protein
MSIDLGLGGLSAFGHRGSAPSPFDAINGGRLAGSSGSHPLHDVRIEELLTPVEGNVGGSITFDKPVQVGDPITGRFDLIANAAIKARHAYLRLVGLKLVEQRHSSSNGKTTVTWVQADGSLFVESPFLEPVIPTELVPGQQVTATFAIPGPPLGPPTAHLGEAIVAWAVEVRWDIAMGADAHVSTLIPPARSNWLRGSWTAVCSFRSKPGRRRDVTMPRAMRSQPLRTDISRWRRFSPPQGGIRRRL